MLASQITGDGSDKEALQFDERTITLDPSLLKHLAPVNIRVPGDLSSAAFLMVAGLIVPDSEILIDDVGVNPTRTGLIDVLRKMGAQITLQNERIHQGEPVADIRVRWSRLHGTDVSGETVVRMIDEFPILAVAATRAHGRTVIHDAVELRVKETDRIAAIVESLQRLGASIQACSDGFIVEGPTPLQGQTVQSYHDHRLGMALAIAGLVADGETVLEDAECIGDSFPGFESSLRILGAVVQNIPATNDTDENPSRL
jgi:3-phosphoshikimate 1-carboxyvinyltransferase